MMNHRNTVVWVVSFCVALTLGAMQKSIPVKAGSQNGGDNPMAAEIVQRGAKSFAANCSFCHGPTAKGSSNGPSLIDSSVVRHDKDGDLISAVIHQGRLDKGMPAFPSLASGQVSDLVAYLHARVQATDSRETAGPKSGYQLKGLLTGDVTAGKAYFNGPGGCNKCHSVSGDLAGIATKYQPSALEGRLLYPRGKASRAEVTFQDGTKIKGTLAHIDPFYVAITDAEGRYHSWERPKVKVEVDDPLSGHLSLLGKYTNKDVHDLFAYLETLK